jgi:hypothetical protein
MSSSYGMEVPDEVLADAAYMKGQNGPEELLETVAELTEISAPWVIDCYKHRREVFVAAHQTAGRA